MSVPLLAFGLVLLMASGRPITAPEWLRLRLEQALEAQLPQQVVRLGEVSLVIEDNWDPRIRARNMELSPQDGGGLIELGQVDARLAFAPLLQGQLALKDVRVSGVFLNVIRRSEGAVNVTLGRGRQGHHSGGTDAELGTFGDQVEGYLSRPALAHLSRFLVEDLTLRYEDLREGRGWTVDGARIALERDGDDVTISSQMSLLGGHSYAGLIEGFVKTSFGTSITKFGLNFEDISSVDIASQTAALSWLEIVQAPISGAMRAEIDATGRLGPVSATLSAEAGVLAPDDQVEPVPFDSLRSYLTYDPVKRAITFDELSVDSDWITASASGHAYLRDMELGLPKAFLVQLALTKFEANPEKLEDVPLKLERSFADFRLRLDPFDLKLGQMVVNQGGHQMHLNGHLKAAGDRWTYAVDGRMDGVDPDRIMAIWPEQLKPKLRKWLDENIYHATLSDINLAVRSKPQGPPNIYADFQFADAHVKFMKTMPPVQDGKGFAVLINNQFRLGAEGGFVTADQGGAVDVTGTGFVVENTRLKQSPAHVIARTDSSTTAIMSLLDRKPLEIFRKANLPVDLAQGRALLAGDVRFQLKQKLPPEAVRYDVRGEILDVRSTHFVKDKELRGDLTVAARNERIDIAGSGTLGAVPVVAQWHMFGGRQNAGKSWLTGTAELSAAALDEFQVGLPAGAVSGKGEIDFEMAIVRDQAPQMTLRSDLLGVVLSAPPLGWRKPKETAGALEVTMTLGPEPKVDAMSLSAPGLSLQGDVSIRKSGGLEVAHLTQIEVGSWLSAKGQLLGRGLGHPPEIVLSSGTLDLRKLPKQSGNAQSGQISDSGPITAQLDKVIVTSGIHLAPLHAKLTTAGGIQGSFEGRFNGVASVAGTLKAHPNGTAVKLTSAQAGQIATSLGVVKGATKGEMNLRLTPREAEGQYDGVVKILNVKVQKVPLMAELLNAISVVGLIEQLNGPGLLFTEVFSRFRLTPERLVIAEASAVGASLGISADGIYSFDQSRFDIQGTVSPIYAVNVIGRPISKRGEGLIGFNYKMQGPANAPEISVNPLSVLTPGFFREIFRRPPPDLSN